MAFSIAFLPSLTTLITTSPFMTSATMSFSLFIPLFKTDTCLLSWMAPTLYLTALLEDPDVAFRSKYDCCFIWVDVSLLVLFPYLDKRVDEMVDAGVMDEIREVFVVGAYCSRGIKRAIELPELGEFSFSRNKCTQY
ncbi:hypothetical protein V8G54_006508 [Vigna mungo]|uniref:Uncharacterized protein n=1 Tax=Vigna mungo TaxID=3915 RepID=A0AAQ3S819_VIGMU